MRKSVKKIENLFDHLIVPALFAILLIVVADLFYTEFKYQNEYYFYYLDLFVISVFVGDLSFKFKRAASWEGFLKGNWVEIIAIAPFFWVFRLFESIVRIGELVQEFLHLLARGGRLFRLFAVFDVTVSRDERFGDFLKRIGAGKYKEAVLFFKHPDEE